MVHPEGASETGDIRLGFDRRVRLEFHGSKISSDGGLLLFRELDQVLGLHDLAGDILRDPRTGRNRLHSVVGLLRQSVFGRLAGYEDMNDADRLALDPVMRQVVGGRAVDARAASASQMGRFETEVLARPTIALHLQICQGIGSTGFMWRHHPNGSRWIWTVRSVRPMARRKVRPGTVTSAACAITLCSCSTSSVISSAARCGPAMCTARTDGKRF